MTAQTSRPTPRGPRLTVTSAAEIGALPQPGIGRPVTVPDRSNVVPLPAPRPDPDIAHHLDLVDQLLTEVVADLRHQWVKLSPVGVDADILGSEDLPCLLEDLLRSGGKRIRPVMAYLGWLSASGRIRSVGHADVVRVSAALELLHIFALVHDDVMDESAARRGVPTTHVRAAARHTEAEARGGAARFGDNIAILLGDLAHAEADALVSDLPADLRRIWRLLVIELVYGQRRDLTGSAAGRTDLSHAREVARLKSGAYTVERPLQLGAAAAHAPEVVQAALGTYGREVGEAFALRDDLLGVWGDPARTGKPAGDDLISAKPTVILALAHEHAAGSAREVLTRVGTPKLTNADVAILREALADCGVVAEVETRISKHVARAVTALDEAALDPAGVQQLTAMAHTIAWRDS